MKKTDSPTTPDESAPAALLAPEAAIGAEPAAELLQAPAEDEPDPEGEGDLYRITKLAGPRVAGQRLRPGQRTIRLTEPEARSELLAGSIEPKT